MVEIIEIEKLKEDLSNSVNHCSIADMENLRNIHRDFKNETYEQFLDKLFTTDEKEQIEKGYARIVDNIFHSSMPNYFQKHVFKQRFNIEFKEV